MRAGSASAMRHATQPMPPTKVRSVATATSASTAFMRALFADALQLGGLFFGHALELALDHLPLDRPDEIDQQPIVEVIVLVLHGARVQALALGDELVAVEADGAHAGLERAFDRHVDSGKRQAALVGGLLLVGEPLDLRVDEDD